MKSIYARWLLATMSACQLPACGSQTNQDSSIAVVGDEESEAADEAELSLINTRIPMIPRRRLERNTTWYDSKQVSVGVETSFNGTTYSTLTQVAFMQHYRVSLWAWAPGDDKILLTEDNVFNNQDNQRKFVYICRFSVSATVDEKLAGRLTVFGNGVKGEDGVQDNARVTQTTDIFKIEGLTNVEEAFQHCFQIAKTNRYQQSLEEEIQSTMKGFIFHDDRNECATDAHCRPWFGKIHRFHKEATVPACVKRKDDDQIRYCVMRGRYGSQCPVYDLDGTRLSDGNWEYKCKAGLTCKVSEKGGWFKQGKLYAHWKGTCQ